jgi:hypothetical protein
VRVRAHHPFPTTADLFRPPLVRVLGLEAPVTTVQPIRQARRWVTPSGAQVDLTHAIGTSRNRAPRGLRDGGTWDGYCLTVRHADSGCVVSATYLGAEVPEALLADALEAVDAYEITGLPRP